MRCSYTNRARWRSRLSGLSLPALVVGCEGPMSALAPQGPAAAEVALIWWVMFLGALILGGGAMMLALYAVLGRGAKPAIGTGAGLMIAGGIVLPLLTLPPLTFYGVRLGTLHSSAQTPAAVSIEVVAHRFWWEIRYADPLLPGRVIVSANEIHIPAGVPVDFTLRSRDVIHSFWIPNLGGKLDAIPGRANRVRLLAARPGLFRGQCAEFCGAQHARMAFYVRAHEPAQFDHWLQAQRGPARTPETELQMRGREEFLSRACVECHTIRGTTAKGREGPDLTRVGGRLTLGAGTLENSADNLARWIAENQHIKPGNRMPPFDTLDQETLRALAAYLESLQ